MWVVPPRCRYHFPPFKIRQIRRLQRDSAWYADHSVILLLNEHEHLREHRITLTGHCTKTKCAKILLNLSKYMYR